MRSFPDKASFEKGIKVRKTAWRDNFRWEERKKREKRGLFQETRRL